jgi:hypothetical protein
MRALGFLAVVLFSIGLPTWGQAVPPKPQEVDIAVTYSGTRIQLIDPDGRRTTLGLFPIFPLYEYNLLELPTGFYTTFANGNAIVIVPDPTVTDEIVAWNDLNHQMDVVFVEVWKRQLIVIAKDIGTRIKIVPADNGSVFLLNSNWDTGITTLCEVSDEGITGEKIIYKYRASPDVVEMHKCLSGDSILHSTIVDQEELLLDTATGVVRSISYRKQENLCK